jgi:hypothetical protein
MIKSGLFLRYKRKENERENPPQNESKTTKNARNEHPHRFLFLIDKTRKGKTQIKHKNMRAMKISKDLFLRR